MIRIGVIAKGEQRLLTKPAFAAGNGEWHDDTISLLQLRDGTSHILHDAHRFMSQNVAVLHGRHQSIIKVQIAPADGRCRYTDHDVRWFLNLRIRNIIAADIFLTVPNKCFHATGFAGSIPATMVRSKGAASSSQN